MNWEPIETVPETNRIGKRVDIYVKWKKSGYRITDAWFEDNVWKNFKQARHGINIITAYSDIKPTHWMKVEAPK